MILLISYQLQKPLSNYPKLLEILQKRKWAHYLDNTWLIQTEQTPAQIMEELKGVIQSGDRLIAVKVDPSVQANGWLSPEAWEWINKTYTSDLGSS